MGANGSPTGPNPDTFAFPASLPAAQTPAGVGATPGTFAVSDSGDATYALDLEVAPGRMGMQPNLSLTFSSSAGVGLAGEHFDLSGFTSMVHRCGSTIAMDGAARAVMYDALDHYCLDGKRLVPVTTTAGAGGAQTIEYRTFPDTFVKVLGIWNAGAVLASGPDHFTIYDKKGNVSAYTQQTLVQNGSVKASWLRTSTTDPRGNGMTYSFGTTAADASNDTQEYWPTQVTYTSNPAITTPGNGADRSVAFAYEPSTTQSTGLFATHFGEEGGVTRTQSHILKSITMSGPLGLIRTYTLTYHQAKSTQWPLLDQIQEYAADGGYKGPTKFTWNDHPMAGGAGLSFNPGSGPLPSSLPSLTALPAVSGAAQLTFPSGLIDPQDDGTYATQTQMGQYLTTDVNGDGLDDLVWLSLDASLTSMHVHVSPNVGGSFAGGSSVPINLPIQPINTGAGYEFGWQLHPMDYDQDGRMDIILDSNFQMPWPSGHIMYLHATAGSTAGYELLDTGIPLIGGANIWQEQNRLADLNGDGVADLVQCNDPGANCAGGGAAGCSGQWQASGSQQWVAHLWSPTANGSSLPGWQQSPIQVTSSQGNLDWPCITQTLIADTDGDGRVELLAVAVPSGGGSHLGDWPWTLYESEQLSGSGMTWEHRLTNLEVQDSSALSPIFMDINGDGHPDSVFPYGWQDGKSWLIETDPSDFYAAPDDQIFPGTGPGGLSGDGSADNVYVHLGSGDAHRFLGGRTSLLSVNYASTVSVPAGSGPVWTTQYFRFAVPLDFDGDGQQDLLIPVPGSCNDGDVTPCWDLWLSPHNGQPNGNLSLASGNVIHTWVHLATELVGAPGTGQGTMVGIGYRDPFLPHIADVDGDGREDVLWIQPIDPSNTNHGAPSNFYVFKFDTPQDQLLTITDGNYIGDVTTWAPPTVSITGYAPLLDNTVVDDSVAAANAASDLPADATLDTFYNPHSNVSNSCEYPRRCVVGTRQVVSGYSLADGQGSMRSYSMRYRDGRIDELGRGWLGFGEIDRLDVTFENQGHSGQARFFDNSTLQNVAGAAPVAVYPYAGQVVKTVSWSPGAQTPGAPPAQVEATFASAALGFSDDDTGHSYFTYPQSVSTSHIEGSFQSADYGYCGSPTVEFDLTPCYPRGFYAYVMGSMTATGTLLSSSTHTVTSIDPFGTVTGETSSTSNVDLSTSATKTPYNNASTWVIGRPGSSIMCSSTSILPQQCQSSTVTSYTAYFEPAAITTGDPADSSSQLVTSLTYDAFGHVTAATATDSFGNQRSSCTSYEGTETFPYATANSLGQVERVLFQLNLGVPVASADVNGIATRYAYDGFGRSAAVLSPDGVETSTTLARQKVGVSNTFWYTTATTATVASATNAIVGPPTQTVFDGGGRATHTQGSGPAVSTCSVSGCTSAPVFATDTAYDTLGRVSSKTLPYLTQDLGQVPLSQQPSVTYQYDGAGRVVAQASPWNTVMRAYNGNTTTTSDNLGALSVATVDGLGRPTSVTDAAQGKMNYGYGQFGHLLQVTNVDNSIRWVTRNAFGRVLTSNDPDRGAATYNYDGFDDVTSYVDANGRTFKTQYDALGRATTLVDPDGTTTWAYDTSVISPGVYALGKLAQVSTVSASQSQLPATIVALEYDPLTRPTTTVLTIDDATNGTETFSTSVKYDPSTGLPASLTYPQPAGIAPLTVNYNRDTYGNLVSVAASGTPVWALAQLDGHGQMAVETYGGKLQRQTTYDPVNRRVNGINTGFGPGSWTLQNLSYRYDARLDVAGRSDGLQTQTGGALQEHFYYDPLDRLTCSYVDYNATPSAACPTTAQQPNVWTASYWPNGSISQKSDVGTYTYTTTHVHAVTTAGSSFVYQYDNVGNQLARPDSTINYTALDLPALYTRTADGVGVSVEYDGAGNRVRQTVNASQGATQTTYVAELYERQRVYTTTASPASSYTDKHVFVVPVGSARLEIIRQVNQADVVQYVWPELLGSTDTVSDGLGDVQGPQSSYDAFGQRRNHNGWTAGAPKTSADPVFGYTGHEDEVGSNLPLVNMKGRIYDPRLGQFLETDPVHGSPLSSQRFNPYSYVLNSPLKFTDPTGMQEDPGGVAPWAPPTKEHPETVEDTTRRFVEADRWRDILEEGRQPPQKPDVEKVAPTPVPAPEAGQMGDTGQPGDMRRDDRCRPGECADTWKYVEWAVPNLAYVRTLVNTGLNIKNGKQPGLFELLGAAKALQGLADFVLPDKVPEIEPPDCPGGHCTCFTADTPIETAAGPRPIQSLHVGDRVLADGGDSMEASTEVDPWTWREVRLLLPIAENRDVLEIDTLRPISALERAHIEAGKWIYLDFEDLLVHGGAYVQSIGPVPPIREEAGHVVLSTYVHHGDDVLQIHFVGRSKVLEPTEIHRLFSTDRRDWVRAGELRPGERLAAAGGDVTIESIESKRGVERVYNLEVEGKHTFLAGDAQVLSHNQSCDQRTPNLYRVQGTGGGAYRDVTRAMEDAARDDPEAFFFQSELRQGIRGYGVAIPTPFSDTVNTYDPVAIANGIIRSGLLPGQPLCVGSCGFGRSGGPTGLANKVFDTLNKHHGTPYMIVPNGTPVPFDWNPTDPSQTHTITP
jgi:RHS repeat-associated protein